MVLTAGSTLHQAQTKCCPQGGAATVGEFPAAVKAPVQYGPGVKTIAVSLNQEQLVPSERTCAVLGELFDCPLAEGTLEQAVEECYDQLEPVEAAIKQGVTAAAVAHVDETGVNLQGTLHGLHVACTTRLTYDAIHPKRGQQAMAAIGILTHVPGRAVHDGLASYQAFAQCLHALYNAHHLRELTFVEEQLGQHWAGDLKQLLGEMKHAADAAARAGLAAVPEWARQAFRQRYDALLALGVLANPLPPPTGQRGRRAKGKARCLVDRLHLHKEDVLAFMADVTLPFDNNQAGATRSLQTACPGWKGYPGAVTLPERMNSGARQGPAQRTRCRLGCRTRPADRGCVGATPGAAGRCCRTPRTRAGHEAGAAG